MFCGMYWPEKPPFSMAYRTRAIGRSQRWSKSGPLLPWAEQNCAVVEVALGGRVGLLGHVDALRAAGRDAQCGDERHRHQREFQVATTHQRRTS
jgi:hypothetical protein